MNIFIDRDKTKAAYMNVFTREKDIFHQISFHEIQHNSSKLRTYDKLKTKIGMETYLVNMQNAEERTQMSKFRLSNYRLMIETGRHNNINSDNRFCLFCITVVENENHCLIECPAYTEIRNRLLDDISKVIPNFQAPPDEYKFNFVMKCPKIAHLTAKFVNHATKLRDDLMKL